MQNRLVFRRDELSNEGFGPSLYPLIGRSRRVPVWVRQQEARWARGRYGYGSGALATVVKAPSTSPAPLKNQSWEDRQIEKRAIWMSCDFGDDSVSWVTEECCCCRLYPNVEYAGRLALTPGGDGPSP